MAITCSFLPSIAEPVSVAMRGRNPNSPSERGKSKGKYKQRIEMNKGGVANTITSVQKDSMVAEPQIIEVGRLKEGKHQQDSVQHEDGICRCICTGHHASTPHLLKTMVSEPQVLTPKRTEYGKAIRKQYESHEIEMSRHDMTTMEPRTDGVSNTLTSVQKDNYLAIPEATSKGCAEAHEGDSVNLAMPNSTTRRGRVGKQMANTLDTGCQQGVVEQWSTVVGNKQMNPFRGSVDGESPCITSACGAGGGMTPMLTDADLETTKTKEFIEQVRGHEEMRYRIRKLTPRECFRLMGVDDADIDKLMNASISNSQLYKCAGNSIVVDVLYHLFRKLYIDKGCEKDNFQQTLF
jgi:site-specific DNA-cytosine methylase